MTLTWMIIILDERIQSQLGTSGSHLSSQLLRRQRSGGWRFEANSGN
jgi:hypothetical protein